MKKKKIWAANAWDDYVYWYENDRTKIKQINKLIKDIERNPFTGIGKPEPLKANFTGWWSRRIDSEHRLVYRVSDDAIEIAQCRFHYSK